MRSRSIRQHLWLLVAVLLSILLVVSAATMVSIRAEDVDIIDLTTVSAPAHDLNTSILQTMTNAQSGLRGYLAAGDPEFLKLYDGAEQRVHTAQGRLRVLLASPRLSADNRSRYGRQEAAQDAAIAS